MHPSPVFVGIDIAKAKLDVALRPHDQTWQIDHDEANIAQRVAQLQAQSPTRIVVEATGGLEAIRARISMISPLIPNCYAAIGISSCVLSSD